MNANGALTGSNFDGDKFNLSASNGATISQINGYALPNLVGNVSSAQLQVHYDSTNNDYWYSVDGVALTQDGTSTGTTVTTAGPEFNVNLKPGTSGTTATLTVSNGSVSTTVGFVLSGNPASVTAFSPLAGSFTKGTTENVTFQVVDANGNPVANKFTSIKWDGNETGLWITAVNGVAMTQQYGPSNESEATPIPLFSPTTAESNVTVPGVLSYTTGGNQLNATTDSKGDISLTFQYGTMTYWTGNGGGSTATYTYSAPGSAIGVKAYTNSKDQSNGELFFGTSAPTYSSGTGTQVGAITLN